MKKIYMQKDKDFIHVTQEIVYICALLMKRGIETFGFFA